MIAIASANIRRITMAVKTLGAAEGFLLRALILANPQAAITIAGPKTHIAKIKISATSRPITIPQPFYIL